MFIFISMRIFIIYVVCLTVSQYTYIFTKGLSPNDLFSIIVIAILVAYRFFLFAIVPGLLSYWLLGRLLRLEKTNGND